MSKPVTPPGYQRQGCQRNSRNGFVVRMNLHTDSMLRIKEAKTEVTKAWGVPLRSCAHTCPALEQGHHFESLVFTFKALAQWEDVHFLVGCL